MSQTAQVDKPVLTLRDRCDQCGSAALVVVVKDDVGTLLFCRHHYNKNADALSDWEVTADERHRLEN